ncbi:hypothetical protein T11_12798 [Trichinella zimbabwensis]|uniref:Uncharacterized protein n=1 Tax=Trichinella zimbabwensis TaxID=268475 RepID=A0A0V1GE30_9BILA|nr:hypothetical protein T11_12798 [Trichinella zimbabwensis]
MSSAILLVTQFSPLIVFPNMGCYTIKLPYMDMNYHIPYFLKESSSFICNVE